MGNDIVLWIVVATALAFDFTNGFHDTANAVATSISTRAMSPRVAVAMASVLNFVGAFLSLQVAATIAKGIVNPDVITPPIVFAGLIGAIFWNLLTWYFGLPSSSSHALIGGIVGSAFAAEGAKAVVSGGLVEKVIIPALMAPVLAFVVAGLGILIIYRIVGRQRRAPSRAASGSARWLTGSMFSLSHGTNDAQKTMGILFLALVANGNLSPDSDIPTWVVVSSASAIAAGTYVGGWRIIRTMGSRIIKMDPAQGFAAQGVGAAVILSASHVGLPALHDARHVRRDHGRRRREARVGGALGHRGQHRRRLGDDAARPPRSSARSSTRPCTSSATARSARSSSARCCSSRSPS